METKLTKEEITKLFERLAELDNQTEMEHTKSPEELEIEETLVKEGIFERFTVNYRGEFCKEGISIAKEYFFAESGFKMEIMNLFLSILI